MKRLFSPAMAWVPAWPWGGGLVTKGNGLWKGPKVAEASPIGADRPDRLLVVSTAVGTLASGIGGGVGSDPGGLGRRLDRRGAQASPCWLRGFKLPPGLAKPPPSGAAGVDQPSWQTPAAPGGRSNCRPQPCWPPLEPVAESPGDLRRDSQPGLTTGWPFLADSASGHARLVPPGEHGIGATVMNEVIKRPVDRWNPGRLAFHSAPGR